VFWHGLARDVAYEQLPRAARVSRHVAAARWVESKAADRVEDLADVLAYHYATALELARVAGRSDAAADLRAPALRFLTLAGERALGLDAAAALDDFERALALMPPGAPERPEALARFGEAAHQAGRSVDASVALSEAIASFQARGDVVAAARAMGPLGKVLWALGDPRWWTLAAEALALLESRPPGSELVDALADMAAVESMQGRPEVGVHYAERALSLAARLGMNRPARALGFRAMARHILGDAGSLDDYREAIAIATKAALGREVALLYNNLGAALWTFRGPVASLEILRAGIAFAKARGIAEMVDGIEGTSLDTLVDLGELDEALAVAAGLSEHLDVTEVMLLMSVSAVQARVLAMRGEARTVAGSLDWLESACRGAGSSDFIVIGLGLSSLARAALGQDEQAAALLAEILASPGARESEHYFAYLPAMVRTALSIGDRALAERLTAGLEPRYPYAEHALVATNAALVEARGELLAATDAYADAADRWERFGVVPEQGFALLGQGRSLLALGRPAEALPVLHQAREIFERLGAAPALAETDALLQAANTPGSL
jgi:tetratricopeptide (TPR) repeat protein